MNEQELRLKSLTADGAIEEILKASSDSHESMLRYVARKGGDIKLLFNRIEELNNTITQLSKKIVELEKPKED